MSSPVISVAIVGDAKKLNAALDDASGQVQGFGAKLGGLGGAAAALGAAGAVVAVGAAVVDLTKAAAADAAEQARLEAAIAASGAATGDWKAQIDQAISAGQSLAFTDTEIRDAMVPLVGATGDVAEAQGLLATAQDLARLKGIDLATASDAVAKAHAGNETALARMIGVSGQGLSATEVLAEAQARAAGQAETYGSSTEGSMAKMSIMFSEVGETIGSAFLPILEEIIPILMPILASFGKLIKDLLPVLIPLLKLAVIPLKLIASAISAVLDVLGPLIKGLGEAIDVIGDFLGSSDKAKGAAGGVGAKGAAYGAGTFVTINTGADPDAVIRAVRQFAGDMGGNTGQLRHVWGS